MPAHVHAELMKQYAEDAATTDEPWRLWECRVGGGAFWVSVGAGDPLWCLDIEYRRKLRTININGHAVPEPMRVEPKRGDRYFVADHHRDCLAWRLAWEGDKTDLLYFSRGLCHSTQEAAIAHARALLSFTEAKA